MDRAFRDDVNALIGKPLLAALNPHGKPSRLADEQELAALRGRASPDNIDASATIEALVAPTDVLRKCAAVAALRGWTLHIEFDQSASIRLQDAHHVTLTGALIDTVSTATDKLGIWTVTAAHYG